MRESERERERQRETDRQRERERVRAVSYTHLDVYKRQCMIKCNRKTSGDQ